jgi:hypothetical protein
MKRTLLKRIALVGLLSLFSFQTIGCSMLSKMFKRKRRMSYKERKAMKRKKAQAALKTFLASNNCKTAEKLYKDSNGYLSSADKDRRYTHYAYLLGRCNRWSHFFNKVVHYGNTTGVKMLKHMESKGLPVMSKFKSWIATGTPWAPDTSRYGRHYNRYKFYAAKHITNWMLGKPNPAQHCRLFKRHYSTFHSWVQTPVLKFMGKAKCPSALSMHRQALLSRNIGIRQLACRYLGSNGSRSDVRRLYTLASTDSSWIRIGRRRTWTSSVCRSAAGRLRLKLN